MNYESYVSPRGDPILNQEVREAFTETLLQDYAHLSQGKTLSDVLQLTRALAQADLPEYFVALRRIFAGISYELHIPLERYYQTVFYLIHQMLGYRVHTEVRTNTGRIDAVIDLESHTYVFEFKLEPGSPTPKSRLAKDSDAFVRLKDPVAQAQRAAELADDHKQLAQAALNQIKDKKYYEKYLDSRLRGNDKKESGNDKKRKPVTLIGAVFTVNTMQGEPVRQVTAWVSEKL